MKELTEMINQLQNDEIICVEFANTIEENKQEEWKGDTYGRK